MTHPPTPCPTIARKSLCPVAWVVGPLLVALAAPAAAHMTWLIPDAPWVARGQQVVVRSAFGHPFECERRDAARPSRFEAYSPSGRVLKLEPTPETVAGGELWRATFTADERGDYLVVTDVESEGHEGATRDLTKVTVNVSGVARGWDRVLGLPVEIEPLTRPYGLPVGVAFRARLLVAGRPAPGVTVEVERLNERAPAEMPPEPFITRVEKAGASGEVTVTFDTPGWWIVTFTHVGAERPQRASLWVRVGA